MCHNLRDYQTGRLQVRILVDVIDWEYPPKRQRFEPRLFDTENQSDVMGAYPWGTG
ncbi:MAG: hypothetical protein ACI8UO_003752 [Verrucomicrobiales bacterium]|jgi:hypothetical protein